MEPVVESLGWTIPRCNLGLVQSFDSFDLPKDSSSYSHTILCQLYVHIHNTHIYFSMFFPSWSLYIKNNPWFEFTSNLRNREPKVGLTNSSTLQLSWTQNTSQVKPLCTQSMYIYIYILRIAYKNMYSTGQHQSPWWEFSDFDSTHPFLSMLSVFEVPLFSLVPTILLNIGFHTNADSNEADAYAFPFKTWTPSSEENIATGSRITILRFWAW